MAGTVNRVILVANLGKDPDVRRTQDNRTIVSLSVATSESWRDRTTGERREKTEWHQVTLFNEAHCKFAEDYLRKGSKVYLEGSLQTEKWTDPQGQERYSTKVVLKGYHCVLTALGGGADGDDKQKHQSKEEDDEIPF